MRYLRLWLALAAVMLCSFGVLGYYGVEIYRQAPPIPERVVDAGGQVLYTGDQIREGQNVWQSIGGQELGSIWGHGAYVAPDWSADWLHREAMMMLDLWARAEDGQAYADLPAERQSALRSRVQKELRANTYDAATGTLTLSKDRVEVEKALGGYYAALFGDATEFPEQVRAFADGGLDAAKLRNAYSVATGTIKDPSRQEAMNAFFFWTAWSCITQRPEQAAALAGPGSAEAPVAPISYTNNWPPEAVVGNVPSSSVVLWSIVSFVLLLAGVGALAWHYAVNRQKDDGHSEMPERDPLLQLQPTASMHATIKYFWTVALLVVLQVFLGALGAHYGVEGNAFFGLPLDQWLPYSVVRTWHVQLGIFWIATAWLATGLYVAPAVSGHEPRFQRLGVNFLYTCLLVIVAGTLFGTWFATRQTMGLEMNFWFGHQGYEYVDLGRFWQIFLFIGLVLWLVLMVRAMAPAFRQPGEHKHLLALFLLSSTAIALFYSAGLMIGRHTHLAMAEYWRWWVVHLWVEGFFEVFATVVIAFLFTRMGLLRTPSATTSVLFSTSIFLAGGILGTFHHLYFTGTPTAVLALGAVFSALEIVPLVLIGFEAYENLELSRARPWVEAYRWPIYFFLAVAFWNLVGAGLFGFLINPPVALYYMQGLNTTPVHGHTALFGVYGMLGLGLSLFCLKGLSADRPWATRALSISFWSLNWGLVLMVLLSLLPVGLAQTWASMEYGLWYARSAEFMQQPWLVNLRWLRIVGDTIFAGGVLAMAWFVAGLVFGWSYRREDAEERWTATDLAAVPVSKGNRE